MRRSIVLSSLLLATATIWLASLAGPAGANVARPAGAASPRIYCPGVEPCCPLPTASADACCAQTQTCCATTTCCTTTACCGTTDCCVSGACCTSCSSGGLTIASSSDPSTADRTVVISGALSATPSAGAQVVLWREKAGQSSFHQLATSTTGSSGAYAFTLKRGTVMADQAFYVASGTLRSGTLEQEVRALVGLSSSARTITAGQAVSLTGHVAPSHAGERVLIEQRRAGTWHVIARPRLSKGSSYSMSHRFAHSGKSELRAVLPLDARNVASASSAVTLIVKP